MEVGGHVRVPGPFLSVPIECEAGWVPHLVRTFWRRENILARVRIRTPDGAVRSLVTYQLKLVRRKNECKDFKNENWTKPTNRNKMDGLLAHTSTPSVQRTVERVASSALQHLTDWH